MRKDAMDVDPEVARLRAELERRDALVLAERRRAELAESQREAAEARLGAVEAELEMIRASNVWRAGLVYYRVRDGFPPLRLLHRAVRRLKRLSALPRPSLAALLGGRAAAHDPLSGLTLGVRGRVSVVLPVFNQASLLAESIESVLAQTHRDLELIVVNDGSRDGVEAVLDRFADDPRVIVLTQPNQKLPSALNNGFEIATGEYFSWTSADNVMLPRQLEVLVRHLEGHPEQAMVYSDYQAIDDRGAPLDDPTFRPQNQDPRDRSRMRLPRRPTVENLHRSGDNFIGASFVYRRDAALLVGAYAEDTFGGEDYDYWLRLHALFELGHVDEVLYRYRVHDNTLNARARELRIAESVNRLLARDAERLAFLAQPLRWLLAGVEVPGVAAAGAAPADVVAYALSRADDPAVRERRARPDALAVCAVDLPLDALDEDALAGADLILATDRGVQAHLEKRFRSRAFLLDPRRDAALLARVAAYRLFEKRHVPASRQPPARVYPVREPLRVGLQVDALDRGGLETLVADLARNLEPARVRATVLVHARTPGLTGRRLADDGVEVVVTGGDEAALVRAVEERRLQVVNLHHSVAGAAAYRARGLASVYTVHSSYVWMSELERAARAAAFRDVDLFLAVSRQVEGFFEARFGIDPRRVQVVSNGLDPRELADAPAAAREPLGLAAGDVVFLQVGSIYPAKLQGVTVEAFRRVAAEVPAARLVLVGNAFDAEYAREVEIAVIRSGLGDRVRFVPWSSRREVAGLLQLADCFVLPSLVEGWSIAVMEAMFFGLPLVLTDVGSAREVVKDDDIGIVLRNPYARLADLGPSDLKALARRYPEENVARLAAAMREIATGRERWRARGAAGREKVAGPFHARTMARAYAAAYEEAWRRFRKPAASRAA